MLRKGRATADAALNAAYGAVMERLSAEGRMRLRDSQRAWITFRDKECVFISWGADGGSVAPMIAASCMAELTHQRAAALKSLQVCAEGDLSCPR